MNRVFRRDLFAVILGLIAGGGAAFVWSAFRSDQAHATDQPLPPIVAATETTSPARSAEPASVATLPRDRLAALLVAGRDERPFWQTLAAVAVPGDKADAWLKLPVLRAKGPPKPASPMNPEFAEFFGLNEAEQAKVVAELDAVVARQAELDFKAAQPIPILESDGFLAQYELALRVAPYPEVGAALHDRLHASLAATLGPERMAVYENWAATSLLADWQGLGLSERTIHIKRQNAGTAYERWDINYEAKTPDGNRQQFNSMGDELADVDQRAGFPISRWIKDHPPAGPAHAPKATAGDK